MSAPAVHKAPLTIPLADGPVAAWLDRTIAVLVVAPVAAVTVALASVTADARGHGTHELLGLDPCDWPRVYGMPCPTCGVTTAACHLVHGHPFAAFVTQPFGAAMMLAALLLGVHAIFCLARRRSFVDLLVRLPFWRIVLGAIVLLLLAWGYKCLVWEP